METAALQHPHGHFLIEAENRSPFLLMQHQGNALRQITVLIHYKHAALTHTEPLKRRLYSCFPNLSKKHLKS
jgi:hypothetical protein